MLYQKHTADQFCELIQWKDSAQNKKKKIIYHYFSYEHCSE